MKDRSRTVQKESLLKETSRVEVVENKIIVQEIPIVSIGKKKRENPLRKKLTKRENLEKALSSQKKGYIKEALLAWMSRDRQQAVDDE